jgi:hypothetical protein
VRPKKGTATRMPLKSALRTDLTQRQRTLALVEPRESPMPRLSPNRFDLSMRGRRSPGGQTDSPPPLDERPAPTPHQSSPERQESRSLYRGAALAGVRSSSGTCKPPNVAQHGFCSAMIKKTNSTPAILRGKFVYIRLASLAFAAFTMLTPVLATAEGRGHIRDRCTDGAWCYRLSCNSDSRDCDITGRAQNRYNTGGYWDFREFRERLSAESRSDWDRWGGMCADDPYCR